MPQAGGAVQLVRPRAAAPLVPLYIKDERFAINLIAMEDYLLLFSVLYGFLSREPCGTFNYDALREHALGTASRTDPCKL
jgi:hypothetical protein